MKIYEAWEELQEWLEQMDRETDLMRPGRVLEKMDELEMKHE